MQEGFAGHTVREYPDLVKRIRIASGRLAPVYQSLGFPVPLLVSVRGKLVGTHLTVGLESIGIVPVRRTVEGVELIEDKVIQIKGDDLERVTFHVDEVITSVPHWAMRK